MTPSTAQELLYNDIVPLEAVQAEHDGLVQALRLFARVEEIETLLARALATAEARERAAARFHDEGSLFLTLLKNRWNTCDGVQAARDVIAGVPMPQTRLKTAMNGPSFLLPPLPNLYFTRDIGFVVDDTFYSARMAHTIRSNEAVAAALAVEELGETDVADVRCSPHETIEGGDVIVVSPGLILVGVGERTSAGAVDALIRSRIEMSDGPVTILAVQLPTKRATIHLDMIVTLVDDHTILAFEPLITGPDACPVYTVTATPGEQWRVEREQSLTSALINCGYPVDLIACGGRNSERRQREQWFSACNSVAVAPGTVILYDTNTSTLEQMQRAGFRVCTPDEYVSNSTHGRVVLIIPGVELARGGGGPRCMTLPVARSNTKSPEGTE